MAFDETFNITWNQRIEKEEGSWLAFLDARDAARGQSVGRLTGPSVWPTGHVVPPKNASESGLGKHLKKLQEKEQRKQAALEAAAASSAAKDLSSSSAALRRREKQGTGASGRSSSGRSSKSRRAKEAVRAAASESAGSSARMGSRSTSMPALPHKYRALASCPVVDRDIITIRQRDFLGTSAPRLAPRANVTDNSPAPRLQFRPETIKAMWWPGRGTYTKYHPVFTFEEPAAMDVEAILRAERPSHSTT
mmetsp:Transcript_132007/g.232460  ORF Transcript_132007/g.232460 Transcript_132007/m.232460 type:complete len:250 (+) Transcript_132007:112-861(+)